MTEITPTGIAAQPAPVRNIIDRRLMTVVLSAALAAIVLTFALGASSASAHQWGSWHWNKGGSYIPLYTYNYASTSATAERARADIHARPHPIWLNTASQHTNISIFDDNVAGASYCGLAEIINYTGSHITHAHARYNRACGGNSGTGPNYAQGVYSQEIGHTLGLDHSNTGDSMGLGYYSGSNGRYCFGISCNTSEYSHPSGDLTSMYRYHTVTASAPANATPVSQTAKIKSAAPGPGEQAPVSDVTAKRGCPADAPVNVTAAWRFKPKSMGEVRAKARSIVLGDVLSVEQAQDDVISAPGEPGGEIRTPRQLVHLKVRKAYKGSTDGAIVTLSKLGGDCYNVDEDPAYAAGQTHLLMLERGAHGDMQVVAPEGRFRQTADGKLKAVGHSDVAASATDKRADDVAG